MEYEKLTTEELVRVIESPLNEWRRLPVKHAQQVSHRNLVIKAFEELRDRLLRYEKSIAEIADNIKQLEKSLFDDVADRSWSELISAVERAGRIQDDYFTIKQRQNQARRKRIGGIAKQMPFMQRRLKMKEKETK